MVKGGVKRGTGHAANDATITKEERPKRARTKPLVRYYLSSDAHDFIGRIVDLSIVSYRFDSYDALAKHPDCKYAIDTGYDLSKLTDRVESLNLVGDLLWPEPIPKSFKDFPVSRYDWLMISADVFLMRYVSVVDCALLLVNTIHEVGLDPRSCTLKALKNKIPSGAQSVLKEMLDDQGALRWERNARIHHGAEREFTQDGRTFRIAALFEHRYNGISGTDMFDRQIKVERSFKEGLVELQQEFNRVTKRLVRQLDSLYNELFVEFEERFGSRIKNSTHGLNAGAKRKRLTTNPGN